MKNISDVVNQGKCVGCGGCVSICQKDALKMERNEEGFFVPVSDKLKCINCGLCNKICPVINRLSDVGQYEVPVVYAGWNKDKIVRKQSSSGGVFSVLAQYVLKKKGFVCGVGFNSDNKFGHVIISKRKDLLKLRGSKYVQSDIGDIYRDVRKILKDDQWVLFSGTPCQVAGLRSFLRINYKKLIVIDIICHGVPSPLVFDKYIKEFEAKHGVKVNKIKFRDKTTGWKSYSFTLLNDKKTLRKSSPYHDVFFKGFLGNLYLNSVCTSCPFAKFPRYSDITLGDYWGIWDYKKKLDDDKGTSFIAINNDTGKIVFDAIKSSLFCEEIPRDIAVQKLKALSFPCVRHFNRDNFFSDLRLRGTNISSLVGKHLGETDGVVDATKRVGIFNMRLPTNNFGAILQSFALRRMIQKLGYDAVLIDYVSEPLDAEVDKLSVLPLIKFREENIQMTRRCVSDVDLANLNVEFDTFIVGSDQVWNYNYLSWAFKDDIGKYFLNFVHPSKKIISYAPSFAEDHWGGSDNEVAVVKKALGRFSFVSVREKSGVDVCKNVFGVKAECVLDPTLLLTVGEYKKLIDSESIKKSSESYVAYFTLDENLEKNIFMDKKINQFVRNRGWELKNIRGSTEKVFGQDKYVYNSIPRWLNDIRNSRLVITDSYHCVIFAIIFKKQFVVISRNYAGNDRLYSLLSILGIKNRFFSSLDKLNYSKIMADFINYKKVNALLTVEKKKSINFLKKSLVAKIPSIDIIKRLAEEIDLMKADQLLTEIKNQEQAMKSRDLEAQNLALQARLKELELNVQSYLNTKTFRYAKNIKKILLKVGIKKFKI